MPKSEPNNLPGLEWSNVIYDIPLSKSKFRKQSDNDSEKGMKISKVDEKVSLGSGGGEVPPGQRRLIDNISGKVGHGEFVGILGASGAGKTTLLNILSARISKKGTLSGSITYDGAKRDPSRWKRTVGYVEQDDALLPRLTVRETIEDAARLRLPDKRFTAEEKRERVEEVIDMLRLEKCEDTQVGGARQRGVSGGERKRTSIGLELASDVSMLFLDEPTSGLDSFAASLLVNNVSDIVKKRNLVCLMTIHQPSWSIFCKLDRVILLARGGVFYDGPPHDTLQYFASIGYDVPEGMNPADYYISLAENLERNEEGEKRIVALLQNWKSRNLSLSESTLAVVTSGQSQQEVSKQGETKTNRDEKEFSDKRDWPTSWFEEFMILATRWFREQSRDKETLYATCGQTFIILLIVGFAFFRLDNSQSDILPKIGVLVFIPINTGFAILFPVMVPFALQRSLMIRERSSGLYRTSSFYLAKAVVTVPFAVLTNLPYFIILYFMVGLRQTGAAFGVFIAVNVCSLLNGIGLGLAIGAVSPSIEIANLIAPLCNVVFLLFGGNFLPTPPPWFIWLKWISPINYTFSALVQNEFQGRDIDCGSAEQQCFRTGHAVIESYNLGVFNVAQSVGLLLAITAVFFVAGYIFLRFTAAPRLRFK